MKTKNKEIDREGQIMNEWEQNKTVKRCLMRSMRYEMEEGKMITEKQIAIEGKIRIWNKIKQ